jgi:hypothetical protein
VVGVAVVLASGARRIGGLFEAVGAVERWARRLTAGILIGVGVYLSLANVFGIV